jgi:hypothetical protein
MTTETTSPALFHSPADAEISRLRLQLEAREEVIRQLNLLILDQPVTPETEGEEPSQDLLASAVSSGRALESEVQRLTHIISEKDAQLSDLQGQLQAAQGAQSPRPSVKGKARSLVRRLRVQ